MPGTGGVRRGLLSPLHIGRAINCGEVFHAAIFLHCSSTTNIVERPLHELKQGEKSLRRWSQAIPVFVLPDELINVRNVAFGFKVVDAMRSMPEVR